MNLEELGTIFGECGRFLGDLIFLNLANFFFKFEFGEISNF